LGRAPGKRPLPGSRSRSSRPSHAGLRMTHKVGGTAESPGGLPPFTAGFALPTSFFPPFPMWAPHDPPLSAPPLSPRERGAGGIGPGSSQNRSSPLPVRAEREWGGAGEGKQGPFPPGPLRRLNARLGERIEEKSVTYLLVHAARRPVILLLACPRGRERLSTAPQKSLTPCAADAGPDRGASEEPIRRRSVTSGQGRAGPAGAAPGVWNFCGAVLRSTMFLWSYPLGCSHLQKALSGFSNQTKHLKHR